MAEDQNFARRWSRRKQAVREEQEQEQPAVPLNEADKSEPGMSAEDRTEAAPEDLPDIESLDADSDYRVFMRDNVPEELRTLALRKLWRSNPLFSIIDGLDEYCEDFTDAALVPKGGVTSAYKVGRGYAEEVAEKVAETAGDNVESVEKVAKVADIDESDIVEDQSDDQPADEAENMETAEVPESETETPDSDTEDESPIEKT
jgi:lysozyme family protein